MVKRAAVAGGVGAVLLPGGSVGYGGERLLLTRHGRPAAALVPVADLERLEALDAAGSSEEIIPLRHSSFNRSSSTEAGPPRRMDIAARLDRGPSPA